jgi:hypothetical protein
MQVNFCDSTYDYSSVSIQQWKSILDHSAKWKFETVHEAAFRSLRDAPLESFQRIELWQKCGIANHWVQPAFEDLCMREKPLSRTEARIIGLDSAILIAEARERLRVECGYDSCPWGEEWRGTACDIVNEIILPFSETRGFPFFHRIKTAHTSPFTDGFLE